MNDTLCLFCLLSLSNKVFHSIILTSSGWGKKLLYYPRTVPMVLCNRRQVEITIHNHLLSALIELAKECTENVYIYVYIHNMLPTNSTYCLRPQSRFTMYIVSMETLFIVNLNAFINLYFSLDRNY